MARANWSGSTSTTFNKTIQVGLLDAVQAGIIVWQAGVVYANRAAASLFGFGSEDKLRGQRCLEALFAAESVGPVLRLLERASHASDACEAQALQRGCLGRWLRVGVRPIAWQSAPAALLTCVDITPQKQTETALVETRHTLQQVLDSVPLQLTLKDMASRYLYVNAATADYCHTTPEALIGRSNEEASAYSEAWSALTADLDQHVLERGDAVHVHNAVVPGKDGSERIWNISKYPLHDTKGALVGIIGQSEDVTEQAHTEQALRRHQQLLQAVLDQVPLPVTVKGPDRRYIIVNRRMAAVWNLTDPDAVIGKRMEDLSRSPSEDQTRMVEMDRRVLETGQVVEEAELPFRTPGGDTIWWHVLQGPLRDEHGSMVGIIGVAEDVTARREAANDLAQMAAALEQAGDAIFITELDGRIRYANAAFERLTGYSRAEVIGQTPRVLKSGLQSPEFYRDVWESLLRGEVFEARYVNRRKDGTDYHTHSIHSPIRDSQGHITAFLSVQRDVSKQVELDERLMRTQRLEALGTLAGGIAHDFNNLLMPIMGYTDLMRRHSAPDSREAEWLHVIADATARARDLVERILMFTRQLDTRHQPMLLKPVIEEVAGLLRSTLPAGTELRTELRADAPILGSPGQMHQVLLNLCVNATQAMPNGGELTVALDVVELSRFKCYLGRTLTGRFVQLSVSDTGQGMDEETLSHVFEPFFTTKPAGQGTGLGLSTVFGIMRALDGAMRVVSAPDAGCTFELYFPAMKATDEEALQADESAPPGSEHVLMVDDEPAIVDLVAHALEELGYRVTACTSGLDALARLEADPGGFDAVVADLSMPDLTGDVLAERARALNPGLPFVLCTGLGDDSLSDDVERGVLSAIVQKPYRPTELAVVLRRLLDRR